LATWKVAPGEATELYRRRWEIESMFAALQSRGFDLEATNLTDPRRVERLIGLLALAFSWTRLVGDRRARREGPPPVKTHGRRERSRFRYGLDRLQSILTTPEPQPKAFFECPRLLRSPTAFLSCTKALGKEVRKGVFEEVASSADYTTRQNLRKEATSRAQS
jgi:hypothetical protein